MSDLVERALAWVAEVHPHARHLARTHEWVLVLDPQAGEALEIAAVIHDIERAFPTDDDPFDPTAPPGADGYEQWHQQRSADIGERWLREQHAPPELTADVGALIRVHEFGGSPRADLLQAADSLSFLETQTDLFIGMVRDERLTRERAEEKLQLMQDRIRVPRAAELGAPRPRGRPRPPERRRPTREGDLDARLLLEEHDRPPAHVDVPVPAIAENEVLVRVHASSVNPIDRAIIAGEVRSWMDYEFPVTLGRDLAGSVERVGAAVTRFAVGDDVFGYIAGPSHTTAPSPSTSPCPRTSSSSRARGARCRPGRGARPGGGDRDDVRRRDGRRGRRHAADQRRHRRRRGQLPNQIAKALGVHVIASARPGAEEAHVRALGADEAVDWSDGELAARVRDEHPGGVQGLIDVVTATPESFAALATATLRAGRTGRHDAGRGRPGAARGHRVHQRVLGARHRAAGADRRARPAGQLRAPVAEVHGLDRIDDAFAALARGALGKIAITFVDGS